MTRTSTRRSIVLVQVMASERQIEKSARLAAVFVAGLAYAACGNDTPSSAGTEGAGGATGTSSTTTVSAATGSSASTASSGGSTSTGGSIPPVDECSVAQPEWIFCDSFETGQ